MAYDTELNRIKSVKYRTRKGLKERGYTQDAIAIILEGVDWTTTSPLEIFLSLEDDTAQYVPTHKLSEKITKKVTKKDTSKPRARAQASAEDEAEESGQGWVYWVGMGVIATLLTIGFVARGGEVS